MSGEKHHGIAGRGADACIASSRDAALRVVEDPHADSAIAVPSPHQIGGAIGRSAVDDENLVEFRRITLRKELIDQPGKHLALVSYRENLFTLLRLCVLLLIFDGRL